MMLHIGMHATLLALLAHVKSPKLLTLRWNFSSPLKDAKSSRNRQSGSYASMLPLPLTK